MSKQYRDPADNRRFLFRTLQITMLAFIGTSFVTAALAQPVFKSVELGWTALGILVACTLAFWWAGRQADRRGG